jgi:hypothetical protein
VDPDHKEEIMTIAKNNYPHARIFQAENDSDNDYCRVTEIK